MGHVLSRPGQISTAAACTSFPSRSFLPSIHTNAAKVCASCSLIPETNQSINQTPSLCHLFLRVLYPHHSSKRFALQAFGRACKSYKYTYKNMTRSRCIAFVDRYLRRPASIGVLPTLTRHRLPPHGPRGIDNLGLLRARVPAAHRPGSRDLARGDGLGRRNLWLRRDL